MAPGPGKNVFPEARAQAVVEGALDEDLGGFPGVDVTSSATIPLTQRSTSQVVARGDGVLADNAVAGCLSSNART